MSRDTEREIGELPAPAGAVEVACGWAPGGGVELMYVGGYTADQMRAYRAEGVAKERERNRPLINQCRAALAEELAAWDIDPPLYHVFAAHAACVEWLAQPEPAKGE